MNKSVTQRNTVAPIGIIKEASCPSLSGKSTLTYHVGCDVDGGVHLRLWKNSSAGFFSNEFISLKSVQNISNTIPLDKPITSFMLLSPIYVGRSQNSPGFMLAVLLQEGLVVPVDGDERVYYRTDGAAFYSAVKELIDSDVDIKIEEKPSKASKSAKPTSTVNANAASEVLIKKPAPKTSKKKVMEPME